MAFPPFPEKCQVATPMGVEFIPSLLAIGLYPVFIAPEVKPRFKLPSYLWGELAEAHKTKSLRQVAKEYGVSHEAIRRVLKIATFCV